MSYTEALGLREGIRTLALRKLDFLFVATKAHIGLPLDMATRSLPSLLCPADM
jgi:hypothetical protein